MNNCNNCDGHIFSDMKEEWDYGNKEWIKYRYCLKCNDKEYHQAIGSPDCTKSKDKKHNVEVSSSISAKFGLTEHRKCTNCLMEEQVPVNHPNYGKWILK